MQTFNENKLPTSEKKLSKEEKKLFKEERKLSKEERRMSKCEEKERKSSSPYRYQKFGDEDGKSNSEEIGPNMIVIEGRKCSATYDKTKINIEDMVLEERKVSTGDLTESNPCTENSKCTTNESTDTADGKMMTLGDRIIEGDEALIMDGETLNINDETIGHRREVKRSITELSILETLNEELIKMEKCYCTVGTRDNTNENNKEVKISEAEKDEHSDISEKSQTNNQTLTDENVNNEYKNMEHKIRYDAYENARKLEAFQSQQSNSNMQEDFYVQFTKEFSIDPEEIHQDDIGIQIMKHSYRDEGEEIIEKILVPPGDNELIKEKFSNIQSQNLQSNKTVKVINEKNSDTFTQDENVYHIVQAKLNDNSIHKASNLCSNYVATEINSISDELPSNLKGEVSAKNNICNSELIDGYSNNAFDEDKDLERELESYAQHDIDTHNSKQNASDSANISQTNNVDISECNEPSRSKTNHGICKTRSQSLHLARRSPRNTSKMFNSFKWRSKSKERETQVTESSSNVDDLRLSFKIFDINIVRASEDIMTTGDETKRI